MNIFHNFCHWYLRNAKSTVLFTRPAIRSDFLIQSETIFGTFLTNSKFKMPSMRQKLKAKMSKVAQERVNKYVKHLKGTLIGTWIEPNLIYRTKWLNWKIQSKRIVHDHVVCHYLWVIKYESSFMNHYFWPITYESSVINHSWATNHDPWLMSHFSRVIIYES